MPGEPIRKCVIWDLDDTLIDTHSEIIPRSHRAAATAMVEAGLNAPIEDVYRARIEFSKKTAGDSDLDMSVSSAFGGTALHADAGRKAFLGTDVGFVGAKPGVTSMLGRLAEHCDQALVTHGSADRQTKKILHAGLQGYFNFISVLEPSSKLSKHDIFRGLVEAYGGKEQVAVIGDRPDKEIQAATDLSLFCIRILKGEWAHVASGYDAGNVRHIQDTEDAERILMEEFL